MNESESRKVSMIAGLIVLSGLVLASDGQIPPDSQLSRYFPNGHRMSQIPATGFVPNATIASRLADTYIDGLKWPKGQLGSKRTTRLRDEVWVVRWERTSSDIPQKGNFEMQIEKSTGAVIRIGFDGRG
jgi:hypothetical protein